MEKIVLSRKLFAGDFQITIYSDKKKSKEILEGAYNEGLRLEKIFNLYDKESFLSKLNKERKLKAPKEFIEVLKISIEGSILTSGDYDVTLGKNFLNRKKGNNLEKLDCSYKDIEISKDMVNLKSKDILLDFGSIAKGYITDKIGEFLINKGIKDFIINSRGDILVKGSSEHIIKIQHPRNEDKIIAEIKLKDCGVATSGDYKQYNKDFRFSHILNKKDYISVTVVAKDLTTADLYSTVLSVVGEKRSKEILNKNKEIKALTVNEDLKVDQFNGLKDLLIKVKEEKKSNHISDFFSKKELYKKDIEHEADSSKDEEWFIDDGPPKEDSSVIFVRAGSKYDKDEDLVTSAS